jgi:hypothetical protein
MSCAPKGKGSAVEVAALPRRARVYEAERILGMEVRALQALPEARAMEAVRVWTVRASGMQASAARALVARVSAARVLAKAAQPAMQGRRQPRTVERAPAAIRVRPIAQGARAAHHRERAM